MPRDDPHDPARPPPRRWLTAGSASTFGHLTAFLCLLGAVVLAGPVLGIDYVRFVWVMPLLAVLLAVLVYALLRYGDRLLDGWWVRRTPETRRRLRRIGWAFVGVGLLAAGVHLLAGARIGTSASPVQGPVTAAVGLFLVLLGGLALHGSLVPPRRPG